MKILESFAWFVVAVIVSVSISYVIAPKATVTAVNSTLGGASPFTVFDAVTTQQFEQGGEVLRINQTGATRTLTATELNNSSEIVIDTTATGAALSLTLPATSTMTDMLKTPGKNRSWVVINNQTAAATTTTVIAGTGIDLQGPTTGDDVIAALGIGRLECWRSYTTDVICQVVKNVPAD